MMAPSGQGDDVFEELELTEIGVGGIQAFHAVNWEEGGDGAEIIFNHELRHIASRWTRIYTNTMRWKAGRAL